MGSLATKHKQGQEKKENKELQKREVKQGKEIKEIKEIKDPTKEEKFVVEPCREKTEIGYLVGMEKVGRRFLPCLLSTTLQMPRERQITLFLCEIWTTKDTLDRLAVYRVAYNLRFGDFVLRNSHNKLLLYSIYLRESELVQIVVFNSHQSKDIRLKLLHVQVSSFPGYVDLEMNSNVLTQAFEFLQCHSRKEINFYPCFVQGDLSF